MMCCGVRRGWCSLLETGVVVRGTVSREGTRKERTAKDRVAKCIHGGKRELGRRQIAQLLGIQSLALLPQVVLRDWIQLDFTHLIHQGNPRALRASKVSRKHTESYPLAAINLTQVCTCEAARTLLITALKHA